MIKISLYGILSQLANSQQIEIENCTDTELLIENIIKKFPMFENQNFSLAVNHKIIKEKTSLNPEDKIALLPPFSGG